MIRVAEALAQGTRRLTSAGTASPAAEARTLLAHLLDIGLGQLVLAPDLTDRQSEGYQAMLDRRAAGEPVQHITGVAHFRGVSVKVGPGVFVPRPETESLAGWALDRVRHLREPIIVELCAGSAAMSLAIATECPQARVCAVELSEDAAVWAAGNLAGSGVELRVGDMRDAFADLDGHVDVVVANPPYIPLTAWESVAPDVRDHDPALALWSGDDGLDATRVVAEVAARLLKPGGWVGSEHAEVQHDSAPDVFVATGHFDSVSDQPDLAGRPRFVTARKIR